MILFHHCFPILTSRVWPLFLQLVPKCLKQPSGLGRDKVVLSLQHDKLSPPDLIKPLISVLQVDARGAKRSTLEKSSRGRIAFGFYTWNTFSFRTTLTDTFNYFQHLYFNCHWSQVEVSFFFPWSNSHVILYIFLNTALQLHSALSDSKKIYLHPFSYFQWSIIDCPSSSFSTTSNKRVMSVYNCKGLHRIWMRIETAGCNRFVCAQATPQSYFEFALLRYKNKMRGQLTAALLHYCTVCSYSERNGATLLKKGGVQIKQCWCGWSWCCQAWLAMLGWGSRE